jgi:hypothetical protein
MDRRCESAENKRQTHLLPFLLAMTWLLYVARKPTPRAGEGLRPKDFKIRWPDGSKRHSSATLSGNS